MPGVVAPPKAAALRIALSEENNGDQIRSLGDEEVSESTRKTRSPMPKAAPSGSSGRGRPSPDRSSGKKRNSPAEKPLLEESALDNPDLGPFLLKLARDTLASGESPTKALDYAIRASKSFERCAQGSGEPSLDLAMSLHVTAAIYCSLGRYEEAVPVLERALQVPEVDRGIDHALAAFSGYMQLGDTHSMLGRVDRAIACYTEGLKTQMQALGDTDPRVVETCRCAIPDLERTSRSSDHCSCWATDFGINRQVSSRGPCPGAAVRRGRGPLPEDPRDTPGAERPWIVRGSHRSSPHGPYLRGQRKL